MSSVFPHQNTSSLVISHSQSKTPLDLLDLPDDILLLIFSFLDEQSLTRVSQISNFLNSISSNHNIWRELFRMKWGPMFPLVPVCTINCCHKYFSDPYANLEPINMLFSYAFYKSLMIPSQILSVITSTYSFKQMFKFRNLLYSYYAPMLNAGLKLLRSTVSIDSRYWVPIIDPLARPVAAGRLPNTFQSIIDKTVIPNQKITVMHDQIVEVKTTTTYCIRIVRTIPTRILKKMLSLIIDYEKIPLWDVALRHCTGMVIKSPDMKNTQQQQQQQQDDMPIKKVDLLHKQIMGNLYMTYARMVYSNSTENDQFFASPTINGVDTVYSSSFNNNNNINGGLMNMNIMNASKSINNINHSNLKASLSNNGIINAMEMIKNKIEQQQQPSSAASASSSMIPVQHQIDPTNYIFTAQSTNTPTILHLQQPLQHILEQQKQKEDEANEENEESDYSYSDSDSDDSDYDSDEEHPQHHHHHHHHHHQHHNHHSNSNNNNNDEEADSDEEEEPAGPTKRMRRVEDITPIEPVLKDPIYIVQHNIPFFVKGMNNHLIDKEVQPFQLDCFGSGFVFEPLENNEVKLTYLLQLTKSEWMEDEAEELLDDLARSRSRSISTLISHAYHLSRA